MTEAITDPAEYDLKDRYRAGSGPVILTGIQAIARLFVEQHKRDGATGRRIATFVSGYQGSPLAGVDKAIAGVPELAERHDVRLVPGMNEEAGATAVWGTQQELPTGNRTHDGVIGFWYGKAPGVDRASDAIRHANTFGANPSGGVVVLAGDDPGCKSSSIPCASERTLAAMDLPILYPRNAEELILFGLHAVALSRASGCWVAMKIVSDVADGVWTLDQDFSSLEIQTPTIQWEGSPWTYRQRAMLDPREALGAEADLVGPRWDLVKEFNRINPVDATEVDPLEATRGFIAAGTAYDALRQALLDLGLSDEDLVSAGIRVLRLGMINPVDAGRVREFSRGLESVVIVEDKGGFIEAQVREILFGQADIPAILGKRDMQGHRFIPGDGELTSGRLQEPLRRHLGEIVAPKRAPSLLLAQLSLQPVSRTAYFCSGCPHNRSTVVPEGSLAGGGIGCHAMVTIEARNTSQVTGLTHMGGEGMQWIGQSAYTDVPHIFQNVGDGTYFHSGQLALQACVAAGVNITYKILYNRAVAMTGAQDAQAAVGVPELAYKLTAEGVKRIIVCADEPQNYRGARFPSGVVVWHRDRLDEAQRILRDTPGVTVLVYDSRCAAEARRLRKRGKLPQRPTRVVINEMVCEGCGDCGVKSNCLSVQPVDTEFGRKTRIDQNSCNTDYSCLDGDCPSFITFTVPDKPAKSAKKERLSPPEVPAVAQTAAQTSNVFLAGIGGTGIVTVNQVLATAALRAGLNVHGLDQTGLSQKAGPVTSHLRFGHGDIEPSNRLTPGSADCIIAFDLLVATDSRFIGYGDNQRTLSVASTSPTPTGDMVYDSSLRYPEEADLVARLDAISKSSVTFDALGVADTLLGGTAAANFLLVGAAYQSGALQIPPEAIEEAIGINGVAVASNIAAFRWGRAAVAAPEKLQEALRAARGTTGAVPIFRPTHLLTGSPLAGETRRLAERRATHLVEYQGEKLARRYLDALTSVWRVERKLGDRTEFSEAVAHGLHRFLAYKDEYEVARLLTDPALIATAQAEVPTGAKLTYRLHPPMLRAMGMNKKIGLGPATHPLLKAMARGRKLRGTRLDPFGYAHVRRLERALRDHYEAMISALATDLTSANYDRAVAAAAAADIVRGYEHVKLGNVERYRDALAKLDLPRAVPPFPVSEDGNSSAVTESKKGIESGALGSDDHAGSVPDEPQYG